MLPAFRGPFLMPLLKLSATADWSDRQMEGSPARYVRWRQLESAVIVASVNPL